MTTPRDTYVVNRKDGTADVHLAGSNEMLHRAVNREAAAKWATAHGCLIHEDREEGRGET